MQVRSNLVPARNHGFVGQEIVGDGQTLIGRRLGHYVVLEPRGRGGMGEVYAAEDTKLERRVALKLLRPEVGDVPDRRARFHREARAAAALNHPNIVHLYSVEESEGVLFITMELVSGRTLRELLDAGAPLPVPRTVAFASQMAEGLACAHAAGILHRDLKPANVMITEDDRVKILDFGLAKLFAPASGQDPEAVTMAEDQSRTGMTFGTAGYMSPEQALGKTLDARSIAAKSFGIIRVHARVAETDEMFSHCFSDEKMVEHLRVAVVKIRILLDFFYHIDQIDQIGVDEIF